MRRFSASVSALSLAIGLLVCPGQSQSKQGESTRVEIVDRSVEHHGGDRYTASRTSLELCSKSGCYQVSAAVRGDRFEHRVKGPFRGGMHEVLIDNDRVLHRQGGREMPVAPDDEAVLRDWVMARVYFCFLPYRLNDDSVVKQDLGLEVWSGRDLHKVKVTFVPGTSTDAEDEFLYWFDPSTGRLEQFAYSFEGSPGGLRFRRLENFRRIGGILFFDQENWGAAGDDLDVDQITPDFVATMRRISKVELSAIRVSDLTGTIN